MVSTPDDFLFLNLPPHICMFPTFFPGNIHHLTSSEMVVKTMRKSQEASKCLVTTVTRKRFLSLFSPSPCLCCFPRPNPLPSMKSCWSRARSDLAASIQASLHVRAHTAVTFPKPLKDVQTLLHS